MSNNTNKNPVEKEVVQQPNRRKVMGVAATSALVAGAAMPNKWTKPVIDSVFLPAHAQTSVASVVVALEVSQEVPPVVVASTASGTATVTFDPASNVLTLNGSVTGLTAPANVAHIHGPGAAGAMAPVLFDLNFPANSTAPTLTVTQTLTAAEVGFLQDGLLYINVHTGPNSNPAGEVRGQIILT